MTQIAGKNGGKKKLFGIMKNEKQKLFGFFLAVQEERQRNKEKGEGEVESSSGANNDMPVEKILEAELAVDPNTDTYIDTQVPTPTFLNI
jgi:hypothetical protein